MTIYVVQLGIKTTIRIKASSSREAEKLARGEVRGIFETLKMFFGCNVTTHSAKEITNTEVQPTSLIQNQVSKN